MRLLLLVLCCIIGLAASLSVLDQFSFPTDIADPACMAVDQQRRLIYTVAPPPITDYNLPSFQITTTAYDKTVIGQASLSGRIGDGLPTFCMLTPSGDGILIGTYYAEVEDVAGDPITGVVAGGVWMEANQGGYEAAIVINNPFTIVVLNVPSASSSDVMTEQTTLRLPTYTAPASFDLLYDSLLDHLFIPVYANGQAHVLMLSGAATTQGQVTIPLGTGMSPSRVGGFLSQSRYAAFFGLNSNIYSIDIVSYQVVNTLSLAISLPIISDMAPTSEGDGVFYVSSNEIGLLVFLNSSSQDPIIPIANYFLSPAAPCNALTDIVIDDNNTIILLSRDSTAGMNDALCVAEAVDFPFMGFASSAQYTDNFPPHLEPHAFALNLTTNTVFVCGNSFIRKYTFDPTAPEPRRLTYVSEGTFVGPCWQILHLQNGDLALSSLNQVVRLSQDLALLDASMPAPAQITWLTYDTAIQVIYVSTVQSQIQVLNASSMSTGWLPPINLHPNVVNVYTTVIDVANRRLYAGTCRVGSTASPATVIEINLNTYATTSTYNTAALSAVCFNTASFFDPVSRHAFMIDSYFFGDVWRFDTPGLVQQGHFGVQSESYGFALNVDSGISVLVGRTPSHSPLLYALCVRNNPFIGPVNSIEYPRALASGLMWDGASDDANNLAYFLSSNTIIRIDTTGVDCSSLSTSSGNGNIIDNGGSGRPPGTVAGVVIFFIIFVGIIIAVIIYFAKHGGPQPSQQSSILAPGGRGAMQQGASSGDREGHERFHDEDSGR